jgi:hypothetical protein
MSAIAIKTGQPESPVRQRGTFVYFYHQQNCEIREYNVINDLVKTIQPTTFHEFYRNPGICVMDDGCLMYAGGLVES